MIERIEEWMIPFWPPKKSNAVIKQDFQRSKYLKRFKKMRIEIERFRSTPISSDPAAYTFPARARAAHWASASLGAST